MAVLPVGFDDRIFCQSLVRDAPSSARTASPFTALFFGSFLPLHGVEFIIEAAGCLWEKDRSVRIVLIGSGQTLARAEARVSEMGLGNVIFEGWQSQTTIAEAVAARADICLGIFGRTAKAARVVPHKIYQAMALRKAVITARTPAIEEFFADRQDIYLCDRTEPESLAGAIRELKDNADLRESIAQKGYEAVWTRYHPAALGATLGEILGRVS
jgi:glycosyltransferase involved in cell wall biosynthesis